MEITTINQFIFWWSVVSTVIGMGLLGWDIWQLAASKKDKELQLKEKQLHKAQVKIWQHFANGINNNIMNLGLSLGNENLKEIGAKQLGEMLRGIQASTYALYTSLNEERLFTDDEIKERQLVQEKEFKERFQRPSSATSPSMKVTSESE